MNVQKFNGQRLKEALQFRGKKMTELADETGISKQSLSLYANAGNKPPFENVEKIARTLDFPVDFFTSEVYVLYRREIRILDLRHQQLKNLEMHRK